MADDGTDHATRFDPLSGAGPLTACIAIRSHSAVFMVSDRMLASGDIQFEPPAEKIMFLTNSIAVMASGDSAFHHEIMKDAAGLRLSVLGSVLTRD